MPDINHLSYFIMAQARNCYALISMRSPDYYSHILSYCCCCGGDELCTFSAVVSSCSFGESYPTVTFCLRVIPSSHITPFIAILQPVNKRPSDFYTFPSHLTDSSHSLLSPAVFNHPICRLFPAFVPCAFEHLLPVGA